MEQPLQARRSIPTLFFTWQVEEEDFELGGSLRIPAQGYQAIHANI